MRLRRQASVVNIHVMLSLATTTPRVDICEPRPLQLAFSAFANLASQVTNY